MSSFWSFPARTLWFFPWYFHLTYSLIDEFDEELRPDLRLLELLVLVFRLLRRDRSRDFLFRSFFFFDFFFL